MISRTGHADAPAPVWPDETYPKTGARAVLAATFCIDATPTAAINSAVGLPSPGAIILPGSETLLMPAGVTP